MTNILYFHGVVRDDSSSVDTNSEIFTERDDQAGSDADLVGKNLSKLVSISTFAKNCLKFGRSFDRGSSSSGVNGSQKLAAKLVLVKGMLKFFPQVLKVEMIKLFLPHVRKVRIETLLSLISEGTSNVGKNTITSQRTIKTLPSPSSEGVILSSPCLKTFTFSDLKNATKNFCPDNILRERGFGCVFKGWLDKNTLSASKPGLGMVVAIKKQKSKSFFGNDECLAEVIFLGCFLHQNLIKLIGYCFEDENWFLVYEFMPKGSLDNHLFRSTANTLPWEIRIKVAIGVARVLSFLHNLDNQVLTWGIRTSSILLDVEFNPKLSGFKLARAGPSGDATHVSTRVMGTSGYAAPEYIATGRLTAKNDVYCFGVVLLELLSGRRARDMNRSSVEQNLVKWAFYLSDKRKLFRIMDTRLEGQYPQRGAYMAAALALQCLGEDAKARPTMAEALTVLEEIPNASKTSSQSQ